MEAQTYSLFEAIGSRESLDLVLEMLEETPHAKELARRVGISKSAASRRLKDLALAGVISKPRFRDAYFVTCEEPTRRFLEAASELSLAILEARRAGEEQLARRIRKSRLRTEHAASERAGGSA